MIFEDACSFHSQFGRISLLSTAKSWYSLEKWVELVDQTWCSHLWSIWQRVGDGQSMKLHGTSIHVSSYPCWLYTLPNLAPFWMGSEWCPTHFRCVRAAHDIFRFQIFIIVYSYMIYPLYIFVFTYKNIRYIYIFYIYATTYYCTAIYFPVSSWYVQLWWHSVIHLVRPAGSWCCRCLRKGGCSSEWPMTWPMNG